MGDWTLKLHLTLICGMSGSGKTTFAFRHLFNTGAACRFVFDHQGRDGPRIASFVPGVQPCYTAAELEVALATRWVVFNPCRMFPGDMTFQKAFAFFCQWVYDASRRAPGKKFFLVNEINQLQDRENIPDQLSQIVLAGREENIELVCCAQEPHFVHSAITGQSSELVCFRLDESRALRKIESMGLSGNEVQALPLGSFISLDRLQRTQIAGRVF